MSKRCSRGYCDRDAVFGLNPNLCLEHHKDRVARQRASADAALCASPECGHHAQRHSEYCGRCLSIRADEVARETDAERKERALDACTTLEELKSFIRNEVLA